MVSGLSPAVTSWGWPSATVAVSVDETVSAVSPFSFFFKQGHEANKEHSDISVVDLFSPSFFSNGFQMRKTYGWMKRHKNNRNGIRKHGTQTILWTYSLDQMKRSCGVVEKAGARNLVKILGNSKITKFVDIRDSMTTELELLQQKLIWFDYFQETDTWIKSPTILGKVQQMKGNSTNRNIACGEKNSQFSIRISRELIDVSHIFRQKNQCNNLPVGILQIYSS